MLREPSADPPSAHLQDADIRAQLQRILSFDQFPASDRRRAMLRFIVEETLAGRAARLKGATIAIEVYGRGADFNSATDPVVRLEARKLRRDLDTYYAGAGRDDPIRIEIPKGAYVPVFEATPHAPAPTPDTEAHDEAYLRPIGKPGARGLIALFALLLLALAVWQTGKMWTDAAREPVVRSAPLGTVTVIVDGFAAPRVSAEERTLADGLSQEIAARLLRFPGVRVHFSASADAPGRAHVPDGLRTASGSYTLSGALRSENERLDVRADLIRGADGRVLWSERYSEPLQARSIWEIEADIAARISAVIGEQYGIARADLNAQIGVSDISPSLESYVCVTRAEAYRRTHLAEDYADVRTCLETATERDPEYAALWAMLAYLRFDGARFGYDDTGDKDAGLSAASDAAKRALSLDSDNLEALKALSLIEQYRRNFDRSIDYARQAVSANPNDPGALANLGNRLGMRGRLDEAVPLLERAIDLSVAPVPFYWQMIAFDHMMKERWEDMRTAAEAASADNSSIGFALLAIAYGGLGQEEEARRNLSLMAERWPLLGDDPRRALEGHELDPQIVDAAVAGLRQAGLQISNP